MVHYDRANQFTLGELWSLLCMHEFRLKPIVDALDVLTNCSALISSQNPRIYPVVHDVLKNDIRKYIFELVPSLKKAEMSMCLKGVERLITTLNRTNNAEEICIDVLELRRRILDQMGDAYCLLLPTKEKRLYDHDGMIFGRKVWETFPDARVDVDEAGKCLALGRSTAAVFHNMRAIEVGVRKIANELGTKVLNKHGQSITWGVMLGSLKTKIDALDHGARKSELYKCHSFLHSVNVAVRTDTMHPNTLYTQVEATEIFEASRSFMRVLADHCQESD